LIIGTVRPEELDTDHPLLLLLLHLRTAEQVTELDLTPLDERDTAALACQVTAQALDPSLLANLYLETEGNPLFVVETVRASLSHQPVALERQAAASSVAPLPALPPKIHAVIHARLAQLSPAARALAQLAATIGRAFTVEVVAEASGVEEEVLVRSLDELWRRRIVREQGANTYDFSHDRIRDVAYHEISPAQRRLLHKRVAQALVTLHASNLDVISGQLGLHYEQALQFEEAVKFYRRAADRADALYAFESVLFYLERVLTLLEKLPDTAASMQQQIESWLKIAHTLIITKGWAASERKQALDRAYALAKKAGDESLRFEALLGLRGYYGNSADWHTAYRLAEEALLLAEKLQDPLRLSRAYWSMGNVHLSRGAFHSSLQCYQRALQLEAELGSTSRHEVTTTIRMAEVLWFCGYPAQAQRVATETLRRVDEQGHPFARIHTREFMWYTYQRVGDELTMRRLAAELNELCERFGLPDYAYPAKFFLGLAMVQDGVTEAGLRQMAQSLESLHQIGNRFNSAYFWALLAQAQAQSGALEAALHSLETAHQIADDSGEQLWKAELVRLTGEYKLRLNRDAKEVESYYHTALQIARQQGTKSLELRATLSLARLWQRQGKGTEAHRLLAESYAWFTEGFDTADLQEAKVLLEELQS
jgi:tetratricopeptide (TPR) repeat protein